MGLDERRVDERGPANELGARWRTAVPVNLNCRRITKKQKCEKRRAVTVKKNEGPPSQNGLIVVSFSSFPFCFWRLNSCGA